MHKPTAIISANIFLDKPTKSCTNIFNTLFIYSPFQIFYSFLIILICFKLYITKICAARHWSKKAMRYVVYSTTDILHSFFIFFLNFRKSMIPYDVQENLMLPLPSVFPAHQIASFHLLKA